MPDIAVPTPQKIDCRRFVNLPPLRNILKEATAHHHTLLDERLALLDLRRIADYRRFLEISANALLPLERALMLAGVQDVLPRWHSHARTNAILHDLVCVGGKARPLPTPKLSDRFAVLGTLYVLEGARLGAAYLLRTIKDSPDSAIATATAYLRHGTGQHLWQDFLGILESHARELSDENDIVLPAREAFDLFMTAARS